MNDSPLTPPVIWWVCLETTESATSPPRPPKFPGQGFRFLKLETALQLLHRRRCPHFIFLEGRPDRAAQNALTQLKEVAPRLPVYLINQWSSADEMQSWFSRYLVEMSQARATPERDSPNCYGLSKRELEILRLMVKGLIKKEIAEQLAISYFTVDNHERAIFKKMNVHTRTGVVAKALIEKIC